MVAEEESVWMPRLGKPKFGFKMLKPSIYTTCDNYFTLKHIFGVEADVTFVLEHVFEKLNLEKLSSTIRIL